MGAGAGEAWLQPQRKHRPQRLATALVQISNNLGQGKGVGEVVVKPSRYLMEAPALGGMTNVEKQGDCFLHIIHT